MKGNIQVMREALDEIGNACAWIAENCNDEQTAKYMWDLVEKVKAALSAPPRNCDVGTAEEQLERWKMFCVEHHEPWMHGIIATGACNCPCFRHNDCNNFVWAQMPYEEVGGDGK